MSRTFRPKWSNFETLVAHADEQLLICAPWISSEGVRRLEDGILSSDSTAKVHRLEVFARLADPTTDSPGILSLARKLTRAGVEVKMYESPDLHAKVYIADRSMALLGSANLTEAGFGRNLELVTLITHPEEVESVLDAFREIRSAAVSVSIGSLDAFVTTQLPSVVQDQIKEATAPVVPVWRVPEQVREPVRGHPPYAVDVLDVVANVERSVEAATKQLPTDLTRLVGRRIRVWACPCYVLDGNISQYLTGLTAPFSLGHLRLDQQLPPEAFTFLEGTIERALDRDRLLFRRNRTRRAGILLTRYPDKGFGADVDIEPDPYFLLRIEGLE